MYAYNSICLFYQMRDAYTYYEFAVIKYHTSYEIYAEILWLLEHFIDKCGNFDGIEWLFTSFRGLWKIA